MAIKLEMLRAFAAVAQSGNLADAADRLGRTPSALSMTLKGLEAELGRPLFASDRKSRLSPFGAQVLELAGREVARFDETLRALTAAAAAPRGLIRVAAVPSVAALVFPRLVREMEARHPGVQLDLRDADSRQIAEALAAGHVDIGIASGNAALAGTRRQTLFADRFGLVAARGHPLAGQAAAPTLGEVLAAGFVLNELCAGLPQIAAADGAARHTVRTMFALIAMLRARDWVTVLPETVVRLAPGELAFRPLHGLDARRTVSLYLRERAPFAELAAEASAVIAEVAGTSGDG